MNLSVLLNRWRCLSILLPDQLKMALLFIYFKFDCNFWTFTLNNNRKSTILQFKNIQKNIFLNNVSLFRAIYAKYSPTS